MINIKPCHLLAAAAAVLLSVSCEKDNPKVITYAEADFDITLTESRQFHDFHYAYNSTTRALAIDESEQKLQELWVTDWNEVTMTLKGKDASFEGANVSSSDPGVVKVEKKDARTFTLSYVADGTSVINVWNSDRYNYSFKVFAKDVIELEYIVMNIDDLLGHHEYKMQLKTTNPTSYRGIEEYEGFDTCYVRVNTEYLRFMKDYATQRTYKYLHGCKGDKLSKYCDLLHDGATFTIGQLYPENASWRHVDIGSIGYGTAVYNQLNDICSTLGWPQYMKEDFEYHDKLQEFDLDWSDAYGRKAHVISQSTAQRGSEMGPEPGKLISCPPYVFMAKIYTAYGCKQPDKSKAKPLYVYCMARTTQQCDYPPTLENPLNKDWNKSGRSWQEFIEYYDFWKYEI